MALVHDENGHFEGVVTNADILEAIVGEFRTDEGPVETSEALDKTSPCGSALDIALSARRPTARSGTHVARP
jgi:CBS domain containing-hemolysin-like protein